MQYSLMPLLVSPKSKKPFNLTALKTNKFFKDEIESEEVETGVICTDDGEAYPIIRGIPRVIEGAMTLFKEELLPYKKELASININKESFEISKEFKKIFLPTLRSFSQEWGKHNISNKTWGLDQEKRIESFKKYMNFSGNNSFSNKLFFDIGAGSGQLTCSLAEYFGCSIVGIDLSLGIEKGELLRRQLNSRSNIHFIQCNLISIPLRPETFDFGHSSGVLHHTPNTEESFNYVQKFIKKQGRLGVWLYRIRKDEDYLPLLPFQNKLKVKHSVIRKWSPNIKPSILYNLIFLYASFFHFFYKLNEIIRGKKHDQAINERVTSLFDTFSPKYVNKHSAEEVKKWFQKNNFENLIESDQDNPYGFNVCGEKI